MKTVLITGGAGYIGSHTAYLMAQKGYKVVVLDALVHNQKFDHEWATLYVGDIADKPLVKNIIKQHNVDMVMHFAAFIEVGNSVKDPRAFYNNNVVKTLALLDSVLDAGIKHFVFSSTCAVYGHPQYLPLDEQHITNPVNPYGANKLCVELALQDYANAYDFSYSALRYFNASGSLPEQGLGEQHDPETHIIPLLLRALINNKPFYIFGNDYDTPDGTCVRDYIHVLDIADAHVRAAQYLVDGGASFACNLGTGTGYSVKQMIDAAERVVGKKLDVAIKPRRVGDPAQLVANATRAADLLGWTPQYSELEQIVRSAYEWEQGYAPVHRPQKVLERRV